MNAPLDPLQSLLVRDLEAFVREVEAFPDDEALWATLPGTANSVGNLALHVAGNLLHFVGAVLGDTGYLRDRGQEFARHAGTRGAVCRELAEAIRTVQAVLPGLSEARLAQEYPAAPDGQRLATGAFLLRLGTHLAYHLGQANHLRRALLAR